MDGLLDFIKTPAGQGLLSAAFGGLAGARRGTPLNNIGRAGVSGLAGYGNALEQQEQLAQAAQMKQLRDMQITEARTKLDDQRLDRETAAKFLTPALPGMGQLDSSLPPDLQTGAAPMAPQPAKFDLQGYAQARMGQNPTAGIALMQAIQKDTPFNKIDPEKFTPESIARFAQSRNYGDLQPVRKLEANEGVVWNPYDPKMAGRTLPNPNKPFQLGATGEILPNTAFQNYEINKAKAGASQVNVNTEKPLLNEIAGGLGKSIVDARGGAQAALGTIGTVNRLNDALDSGKVMAGPGTTFRQFGLQIGNVLGVSGKDSNERLLNTRQAIQSLAQLELDAAQQMKGQGQITEAERSIIRRAASGDVDSMTTQEIRVLAGVLDRTARTKIRGYNAQVAPLAKNPNAAPIAPFLSVEEPPARAASSVIRFDANGNRLGD